MSNHASQKRRLDNPANLVWFIIVLGCCVGIIMSTIVWLTNVDIRNKRIKLNTLAAELVLAQSEVEKRLDQNRWEYYRLLSQEELENAEAFTKIQTLLAAVEEYRSLVFFPVLADKFDALIDAIRGLEDLQGRCLAWAERRSLTKKNLPVQSKKLDAALGKMAEAIEQASGRQQLERVLRFRRFRQGESSTAEQLAQQIVREGGSASDFSVLKAELGDLALLIERLRGEGKVDYLADLKDNRLRTVLVRLRRGIMLLPREESATQKSLFLLLQGLEGALFGTGYTFANEHQTIQPGQGGFYGAKLDHLRFDQEREILRLRVIDRFDMIRLAMRATGTKVDTAMQDEAERGERSLQQAWQTMLFVSFMTALIFILVSARILKAIRGQVHEIKEANLVLDARTKALLVSQESLREKQMQLEHLSGSLLTAQEDERQRVSRELHDGLGQSLTALKLQVRSAAKSMGEISPQLNEKCDLLRQTINEIIEDVRRMSRDLSPTILDDLGIEAAIEHMCDTYTELTGLAVERDIAAINLLANHEKQRNVYRILQELLNNIAKHARAENISVRVRRAAGELQVRVEDDGQGFEVSKMQQTRTSEKGMGLTTIAERVRIMGGTIEVSSEPGRGTEVFFSIPL